MKRYIINPCLFLIMLLGLVFVTGINTLNAQVVEIEEEIEVVEENIEEIIEEELPESIIETEPTTLPEEELTPAEIEVQEEIVPEEELVPEETIEEETIDIEEEQVITVMDSIQSETESTFPVDTVQIPPIENVPKEVVPVMVAPIEEEQTNITTAEEKTEDYEWKLDKSKAIAFRVMGSTNGYGAEAVFKVIPRLSVRLGYESLKLSMNTNFDVTEEEFDADIEYKVGAFNAIADFYYARYLYIAAGVGFNAFSPSADLKYAEEITYGDLVLTPDEIGTLTLEFEPTNKVSPYLGLGFGRTIGSKNNLAFSFEIGAYYQGAIKINASGTGLLEETASDEYDLEGDFEEAIKSYQWMPVLRFGVSYKIVSFD